MHAVEAFIETVQCKMALVVDRAQAWRKRLDIVVHAREVATANWYDTVPPRHYMPWQCGMHCLSIGQCHLS